MGTVQTQTAVYDFAVDGGGIGTIVLHRTARIPANALVTSMFVEQVTPLTSGGSATISLGIEAVGDFTPAAAFDSAVFTTVRPDANAVGPTDLEGVLTSAPRTVRFVVAGAALTGGKLRIYVTYASVGAP
jgi:hypothetical protein